MKLFIQILLVLCFVSSAIQAQNTLNFDSTLFLCQDKSYINTQRQVEVDNLGNKYVMGFFKNSLTIDNITLTHNSSTYEYSQALFIAKYDSNKNLVLLKKIAEADTLASFCFSINWSSSLGIAINYYGTIKYSNDSITSAGGADVLIIKKDLNLSTIGSYNIGNINNEVINNNSISFDKLNNIYFTCGFNGSVIGNYPNYELIIGNDTLFANTTDFLIAKFDTSLNPVKAWSYPSNGSKGSGGICYSDGYLYVLGGVTSINNTIGGINFSYPIYYTARHFVAKLDTLGNAIWVRKFGNEDQFASMGANALAVQGNRVYVGGSGFTNMSNTFHFEGGPTLNGNGASTEYYISSYDTAGNFKWNTIAKNFNEATIASMACDSSSNVYVTGQFDTKLQFPNDTLITHGGQDAFVLSYDSSGNYRWAINGGGTGGDRGDDIALDHNGKPWIVGGTTSTACTFGNDLIQNPWSNAFFMASIDSIGYAVGVNDIDDKNIGILLYPNPVHDELLMQVRDANSQAQVIIYDLLGRVRLKQEMKEQQKIINTAAFQAGIYIVKYSTDEQTITHKIIVEH